MQSGTLVLAYCILHSVRACVRMHVCVCDCVTV